MRTEADLRSIWRFSTNHRDLLAHSELAGCFYCCRLYPPAEIIDWVDVPAGALADQELDRGTTALCPRCGIDAVLPSAAARLDPELLSEMHRHYF